MKNIKVKTNFPLAKHYAIILFTSYYEYDSYDTSSGNHKPCVEYLHFQEIEELKEWIKNNSEKSFSVIDSKPISYKKEIIIDLN